MTLGLNRGEILLVAFIFGLIWIAGVLPKIAKRFVGSEREDQKTPEAPRSTRPEQK